MPANFAAVFNPQSIAIIGASRSEKTVGNDVVKNLATQGFKGKVYPVNPKVEELYGLKVYPSVEAIPENFDLAVIAIPAVATPGIITEIAAKGAKAAIVISAGFKETGNIELEKELVAACDQHDVTLIGPNCLGVLNPEIQMNASFAAIMPDVGNVAFVSQSGALCTSVLDYAQDLPFGFSKFLSIGNKAAIDEVALLNYFAEDDKTKVIAIYAEQLQNAPAFIETAKKVTLGNNPKPIVVLKAGRTSEGAAAVASHTGSLSSIDAAYDALFAQSGVIRANTIRELFEYVDIFSRNPFQVAERVAIVTNAGGPGVLTTDEVIRSGGKLAKFSEETKAQLKAVLPPAASVNNPVDVLGDSKADRYKAVLDILGKDDGTDGMIVLLTPQSMTEIEATAQAIIDFRKTCTKPLVVSFLGKTLVHSGVRLLESNQISTTAFPELAARGLSFFSKFIARTKQEATQEPVLQPIQAEKIRALFDQARASGQLELPEATAIQVMAAAGFSILKSKVSTTAAEASSIVQEMGTECAFKIVSPDILHKSDVGGVKLHVTAEQAAEAFDLLMSTVKANKPEAKLEGVLIVEMAPADGVELILGVNESPGLGKMLMVGLGGIYVEVFKDVSFGFAPLTQAYAQLMIKQLKSAALLKGVRGHEPYDQTAVVMALLQLSQLVQEFPEIVELDINPLLVLSQGQGVRVLDGRIRLQS